jgi:hypothetical protein
VIRKSVSEHYQLRSSKEVLKDSLKQSTNGGHLLRKNGRVLLVRLERALV